MEKTIVETLLHSIEANIPVALVSVTGSSGSSPGKVGAMMVVGPEGSICGTVGGGTLEQQTITEAIACLGSAKSRELSYRLAEGDLEMSCGGDIRLFIKVFAAPPQLYIVGGGHIGYELYKLASYQGFTCLVFDDRPDYVTQERFPLAQLVISEDIPAALQLKSEQGIDENTYITIATSSHLTDKLSLEAVAQSDAGYIGMIGSSKKIAGTLRYLLERGIARETLEKLYTPMGLNIASIQPKEIAVSIFSEILLVKNGGSAAHMKKEKKIHW